MRRIPIPQLLASQQRLELVPETDFLKLLLRQFLDLRKFRNLLINLISRNGINRGVEGEGRDLGVFLFDVDQGWVVVGRQGDSARPVVVEVWECDLVFGSDWVTDDELVDVVELVPVLVEVL